MSRNTFFLEPLAPFRLDLTVWTLRRRPDNAIDRWDGTAYRRMLALADGPVEVAVLQTGPPEAPRLRVTVRGAPLRSELKRAVTAALERLLGLRADLTAFYRLASPDAELGPMVQRFRGMKPPRFLSVFEGVVNAIACQQLTLTIGIRFLNALAHACGPALTPDHGAVHGFPRPEDLAGADPAHLRSLGFSRHKCRAILELAQTVALGNLNLENLTALPDEEAMDQLQKLRSIGRWTAQYVLLRGLGRTHLFPGDDVGARNNLCAWLNLPEPLDYAGVQRTLEPWRGYGGLIYFHLLLSRVAQAGHVQPNRGAWDQSHAPTLAD